MNSMVPRVRPQSPRRKKASKGACWIFPRRMPAASRTFPNSSRIRDTGTRPTLREGFGRQGKTVLPHVTSLLLLNYVVMRGAQAPLFFSWEPQPVSAYYVGAGREPWMPYFSAQESPRQVSPFGRYSQPTHPS